RVRGSRAAANETTRYSTPAGMAPSAAGAALLSLGGYVIALTDEIRAGGIMDRGRIESMPKVRKGARSRRSGRSVAVNNEMRQVPRESIVAADLPPRRESETAVLKANPEELTKAVARATEVF